MHEKRRRSFAKAISWRFVATVSIMAVVFIYTGDVRLSVGIGIIDGILKFLTYYAHERVWDRFDFGEV